MLIDLLRKRRSVRRYQKRPIEGEVIDVLIESMLRAPSSRGLNPCQQEMRGEDRPLERAGYCHFIKFIKRICLVF